MIGLVCATAAGRAAAELLSAAWPDRARIIDGKASTALRTAFEECDGVVAFLAVGATVRVLAPLLAGKAVDPPVVCVDEARRYAVAVLGGHHGANELAVDIAAVLGAEAVVTTATDAVGGTPLDSFGADLGFTVENPDALAAVGAAILSGRPVGVESGGWPVLPIVTGTGEPHAAIHVSDVEHLEFDVPTVVYRPPSLVIGVGASRGVDADEILRTIDAALAGAGLSPRSVRALASIDVKADERGLLEAARRRGWPLRWHTAEQLTAVPVPNPSQVVRDEVGTASVAEAAARYDGAERPLGELVVAKTRSDRRVARCTVAVARHRARGRLALIGLGPGARDLLAPRAAAELRRAAVVVGLDQYIEQVRDVIHPGARIHASGLGSEEERAHSAVQLARAGNTVALIGSGDAGVYAMASPALEHLDSGIDDVDVIAVPGITASIAAANLLGAPLGHDHASISLSDLHTPWEAIERRVRAAAQGDFVVCFYNPRSRKREWQLPKALAILAEHRPTDTPIGCVRNAGRPDERVWTSTLETFDVSAVDMYTLVVVGSSHSRLRHGRITTSRGYQWS